MSHIQEEVIKLWLELEIDCISDSKYSLPFHMKGLINSTHCNITCIAWYRSIYLYFIDIGLDHVLRPLAWKGTLHMPWPNRNFKSHHVMLPASYSFPSATDSHVLEETASSAWNEEDTGNRHAYDPSSHMSKHEKLFIFYCCKPLSCRVVHS